MPRGRKKKNIVKTPTRGIKQEPHICNHCEGDFEELTQFSEIYGPYKGTKQPWLCNSCSKKWEKEGCGL